MGHPRMGDADTPRPRGSAGPGSRARGNAPGRDIDLAVTIGGDDPGTVRGNYFALRPRWQEELSSLLEAKAHVSLYNDPDPSPVRGSCDECSLLLFPTQ